jgi:effector-binding domain-containing protein
MDQKFEIIETAAQPVLSVRKTTSVAQLPQELGAAYHSIITYLGELGQQPADAAFACYYNMDMENLDVEMGFPVAATVPEQGQIKASEIPAGKKATALYAGPYQEMGPTYEALTQWIKDNGHQPTGVVYELYYNSPMEVPESELLTKIVFLLK